MTVPTAPRSTDRARHRWCLPILGLLLAAMLFGATRLAFLCDDAFITFRYVANAHAGLGLVWNPPPFQPVEGYTGFAWAMLLWATWSWLGVEPPDAANTLSLLCGVGQFAVLAAVALRLRRRDGQRLPPAVGLLALAAIVGNRTFLQWLGSGLETPLWNLGFVTWVLLACRGPERRTTGWLMAWSAAAALAALTRPDGLLLVAATGLAGGLELRRRQVGFGHLAAGFAPLLPLVAQLAWRRWFYGEWLPNTYYAKVTGAWPEAGMRYFACFAVEHAVWLWLPLCLLWLLVECVRGGRAIVPWLAAHLPAAAAVGAVACHFAYYTVAVGGDHFEYRVYSHLVPLGLLAAAAMAARLGRSPAVPAAVMLLFLLGNGVGWLHLLLTRDMPVHGFRPVATQLPGFVQPLARWFDRQQAWLRFRMVGLRCNHHAIFLERARRDFPNRLRLPDPPDPFPAYATGAVGLPGWCLPDAVVVDLHGLNDWVVARTPIRSFGPPPSREQLRPLAAAADADHDGFLDATELRTALTLFAPDGKDPAAVDYLGSVLLAIYARQRPEALALDEVEQIGESLTTARSMAHERSPPDGYLAGLDPNVTVLGGIATMRPRAVPLRAEAIVAFEAQWRAKVRREFLGKNR